MTTNRRQLFTFAAAAIMLGAAIFFIWRISSGPADPYVTFALDLDDEDAVEAALANATANPLVVVYIHVDWSVTAVVGREHFQQFAADWHSQYPDHSVNFHCIDFTPSTQGYSPITNLPGWTETRERIGRFPFGGSGEIAWIADGQLLDMGSIEFRGTDNLIQKTRQVFANAIDTDRALP